MDSHNNFLSFTVADVWCIGDHISTSKNEYLFLYIMEKVDILTTTPGALDVGILKGMGVVKPPRDDLYNQSNCNIRERRLKTCNFTGQNHKCFLRFTLTD